MPRFNVFRCAFHRIAMPAILCAGQSVSRLVNDGYVQTMQGKRVRNIYQPIAQTAFTIGEIESFRESAARNNHRPLTKVLLFTEFAINERQAQYTGFPVGTEIYYIQRLHYLDDILVILNHNYFFKRSSPRPHKRNCRKLHLSIPGADTAHDDRRHCMRIMTAEKMTAMFLFSFYPL